MPGEPDISLGAEFLLLSVDPGGGGLLGKRRRNAQSAARGGDDAPVGGTRARGCRPPDRYGARHVAAPARPCRGGESFRRVRDALADGTLGEGRDRDLALLLAWSGVLAKRLSKHERRVAARRIRAVAETVEPRLKRHVPNARPGLSPVILALGLTGMVDLIDTPPGGDTGAGDGSVAGADFAVGNGGPD